MGGKQHHSYGIVLGQILIIIMNTLASGEGIADYNCNQETGTIGSTKGSRAYKTPLWIQQFYTLSLSSGKWALL